MSTLYKCVIFSLWLFPITTAAQENLLKNGGIEDDRVFSANVLSSDGRTSFARGWFIPTYKAPEYYYNSNRSTILPAEGNGVIGMVGFKKRNGFRSKANSEFVAAELKEPLKEGQTYLCLLPASPSSHKQVGGTKFRCQVFQRTSDAHSERDAENEG